MKKQKICIIGDGLSGLTAALVLSGLKIDVDLISSNKSFKNIPDHRVTAISQSNYKFLSDYLSTEDLKSFWSCKNINLYHEKSDQYYNFMNLSNKNKNIIHIIKNNSLKKIFIKKINKYKNVNIIKGEVKKIDTKKSKILIKNKNLFYDLILLCLGRKSNIVSELVGNRNIKSDKNEIALTSMVEHNSLISDPKQYFLKEGPLAILPINKKAFSFVWSLNKEFINLKDEKIKDFVGLNLKKVLGSNINFYLEQPVIFPISFKFNINFSKKNTLVLGESSYNVRPIAGQGFNLIFRDIQKLFQYIQENQSLGLPIKDSLIIKKFVLSRKPENLLFGLGIDFTNNFFKCNKSFSPIKDFILKDINKFDFLKRMSLKISDKGIFSL